MTVLNNGQTEPTASDSELEFLEAMYLMDVDFCKRALEEALSNFGSPEIRKDRVCPTSSYNFFKSRYCSAS
jgi:hypothetical protein